MPRNRSEAIADLAVLPVFHKLNGRVVVLVGGTDAAAWKADLLCAAGATVRLFAKTTGTAMQKLMHGPRGRQIVLVADELRSSDLSGVAMAVGDFEDRDSAARFAQIAQERNVPFNVIDKPEFCSFQIGSIVNRSPIVIGISTDGGAPVLAQTIRHRIENLLPAHLSHWGKLAKRLRVIVADRIANVPDRRKFWSRFAGASFISAPPALTDRQLFGLFRQEGFNATTGSNDIIQVTSNDPDLLTVKATRLILNADIILHDPRISNAILERSRREARRICISPDCASIDDRESEWIESGKNIVRLEWQDEMKFGEPKFSSRRGADPNPAHRSATFFENQQHKSGAGMNLS